MLIFKQNNINLVTKIEFYLKFVIFIFFKEKCEKIQ